MGHNLENVMESVMRAEGSKAVVEAYKSGLEALKAISSKSPSLEEVEGLVGEVGEAIEKEEGLTNASITLPCKANNLWTLPHPVNTPQEHLANKWPVYLILTQGELVFWH